MDAISKRRRFQAPVTSFFDSHSDDENQNQTCSQSQSSSSPFDTDSSTQASLLTVGCRIRKSVPEGYKTHTSATGASFTPRPFMSARLSPATLAAINAPSTYSSLTPYGADYPSSINNVGGLLPSQPIATATFCGISLRHMASSSSINSSPSSSQGYTNKNKRAFDDSSDDDETNEVDGDFIPQLPPSVFSGSYMPEQYQPSSMSFTSHHRRGSSYPFKHTTMPDLNMLSSPPQRTIAVPKTRMRAPRPQENSFIADQENSHESQDDRPNFFWGFTSCASEINIENSGGDFGDAGFLRARDEVEMDCS